MAEKVHGRSDEEAAFIEAARTGKQRRLFNLSTEYTRGLGSGCTFLVLSRHAGAIGDETRPGLERLAILKNMEDVTTDIFMRAFVLAALDAHEQGGDWPEIGKAMGVSARSAETRFDRAVKSLERNRERKSSRE